MSNKSNVLLVEQKKSTSGTNIAANEWGSISPSVTKSGYTPLGTLGCFITSDNTKVVMRGCYVDSNMVWLSVYNAGSATTWGYRVYILYMKN